MAAAADTKGVISVKAGEDTYPVAIASIVQHPLSLLATLLAAHSPLDSYIDVTERCHPLVLPHVLEWHRSGKMYLPRPQVHAPTSPCRTQAANARDNTKTEPSEKLFWQEYARWGVTPALHPLPGSVAARSTHRYVADKGIQGVVEAVAAKIEEYSSFVDRDDAVVIAFTTYISPASNVVSTSTVLDGILAVLAVPETEATINASESLEGAVEALEAIVKPMLSPLFSRINNLIKLDYLQESRTRKDTHAATITCCLDLVKVTLHCSTLLAHSQYAQLLVRQQLAALGLAATFEVRESPGKQVLPIFSCFEDIQCTWPWVTTDAPPFNWIFDGESGKEHNKRLVIRAKPFPR